MDAETIFKKIEFDFPVEIRKFAEESGEFHIIGYAATSDFDLQGDVITEEALKASSLDLLKNSTVLLNHDLKQPIGKVTKAEFNQHGLLIDVLISKTEPEVIQKIKEGVLNKFSIRGQVLERERKFSPEHDRMVNVIKRMSLVEVSLVSVPANPEARAIGWYISKALENSNLNGADSAKGEPPMNEEEIVIEEIPQDNGNATPPNSEPQKQETLQPSAVQPEVSQPTQGFGGQAQPASVKQEDQKPEGKGNDAFNQMQNQKPSEIQKNDQQMLRAQLEPVFFLLDKIIGKGGETATIAQQIKATLKHMAGDTAYPYPSVYPYPKTVSKDELGKMIAGEVSKQIETTLKSIPTLRKGLIQPEQDPNEVKKQFEGLPPEKKLRAVLALEQNK